jgi:hypothetical protein
MARSGRYAPLPDINEAGDWHSCTTAQPRNQMPDWPLAYLFTGSFTAPLVRLSAQPRTIASVANIIVTAIITIIVSRVIVLLHDPWKGT